MSEGRLSNKARSADKWIKSKVSWWPTYGQSKKGAKKVKKIVNPGNVSATKTIGEAIERVAGGPRRAFTRKK